MTRPDSLEGSLRSSRSIQEFWIDFLLEEEFAVDPEFLGAFLDCSNLNFSTARVVSVHHSVAAKDQFGTGESDLIVLFDFKSGKGTIRGALLIENKINASFQPHQADRYRFRGRAGVEQGLWAEFRTVLIAPSRYISDGHGFDVAVAFEAIAEMFCPRDVARREFRRARFAAAIAKKEQTGVKVVDEDMTLFRRSFFDLLAAFNVEQGTDFAMKPPMPTYHDDNWFLLKSGILPPNCNFRYMARAGIVELSFNDTSSERLAPNLVELPDGAQIKSKGKYNQHTVIALSIEPIQDFSSFERSKSNLSDALASLHGLWTYYRRSKSTLDNAIEEVRKSA